MSRAGGRVLPMGVGVAALLAGLAALLGGVPERDVLAQDEPPDPRPNIVVVMTDDQDLSSLGVMDAVRRDLAARGTTFESFFATFPLCCPSRATFLTGQYAHNHGLLSNDPPNGGYPAFSQDETALPVALHAVGYRTALIGKYLNGYGLGEPTPPGWDVWRAALGATNRSYDYDLSRNGDIVHYGKEPDDYRTDVYALNAARVIRVSHRRADPFFLTVALGAPHRELRQPPQPGPGYDGRFDQTPLPTPPSFNETDVSDKPPTVRASPPLTEDDIARLTARHRGRLASLLPVDALVERVVRALRATDELSSTYLIFTSDNGYMLGEHRLQEKGWLYEESARVPLIIRGPGVPRGEVRDAITANVDLAPTILDAAGAEALAPVDGRSLLPLAADPEVAWRQEVLLENRSTVAIRTREYMYAEHRSGERELYDLREDPYQLQSLHADPEQAGVVEALSERLAELRSCAAAGCP